MPTVGERIKARRTELGMTQADLAKLERIDIVVDGYIPTYRQHVLSGS